MEKMGTFPEYVVIKGCEGGTSKILKFACGADWEQRHETCQKRRNFHKKEFLKTNFSYSHVERMLPSPGRTLNQESRIEFIIVADLASGIKNDRHSHLEERELWEFEKSVLLSLHMGCKT